MTVTTLVYTGAVQDYIVPAGIYAIDIEWWGAAGGHGAGSDSPEPGQGGYTRGTYATTPGTVIHNYVGGQGHGVSYGGFGGGGWNGGGTGHTMSSGAYVGEYGGGGGGASDSRVGGTTLAYRIGVAGGGAGSGPGGRGGRGGFGGGAVGQTGAAVGTHTFSGGGLGGTQTAGNALGVGGDSSLTRRDGGGGGGWWGGCSVNHLSIDGSGGGGGSGNTGTLTSPAMLNGVQAGNGQIIITAVHTSPLASTLTSPPNNGYVIASVANVFTWAFHGDVQTSADFRWQPAGGSWTTVTAAATTAESYSVAAATFTAGTVVEWQVMTYDSLSLTSPWSASSFVNIIAALPAVTITTPADGALITDTPIDLEWTLPSGFTCDAWRAQRNSAADGSGTMFYDSDIVAGADLVASVPLDASPGRTDYLRVSYRYYGHWAPYASVSIVDEFGPPWPPIVTCVADPATASVAVTITNPPAGVGYTDAVMNDLFRTNVDGTVIPIASLLPPNAVIVDDLPGAGLITYTATAYAASGATSSSAI